MYVYYYLNHKGSDWEMKIINYCIQIHSKQSRNIYVYMHHSRVKLLKCEFLNWAHIQETTNPILKLSMCKVRNIAHCGNLHHSASSTVHFMQIALIRRKEKKKAKLSFLFHGILLFKCQFLVFNGKTHSVKWMDVCVCVCVCVLSTVLLEFLRALLSYILSL